ncbi:MAG: thioredoxin family protein [Hyphomicrobiaceae bacterium]|nr:thioredoxin family protein [Hyphomicrobiaceae bacterium]
MFTQPGCPYCAAWESEIGPIWPRTAEGRAYPLSRMDRRDPLPQGVTLARGVTITPTFVLLVDGEEAGRVEGYPGEEMFWIFLERMLRQADLPPLEG